MQGQPSDTSFYFSRESPATLRQSYGTTGTEGSEQFTLNSTTQRQNYLNGEDKENF